MRIRGLRFISRTACTQRVKAAELEPFTVHQCRHTCASFMIAAGANAKALSVILGHASIAITFDRYGHLMKGGEDEVGRLLDRYINGA
jgi:integrase